MAPFFRTRCRFSGLHLRDRQCGSNFNHFEPKLLPNSVNQWLPLRRSRSVKVTDFGTNGNPVCDFLFLNNRKWWRIIGQIFVVDRGVPLSNVLVPRLQIFLLANAARPNSVVLTRTGVIRLTYKATRGKHLRRTHSITVKSTGPTIAIRAQLLLRWPRSIA